MRVLIIEDDPVMTNIIRMTLEAESYECDAFDLGQDGVTAATEGEYDIVILDLMLPDIGGYEVLSRLRAAHIETPVLILSGFAEVQPAVGDGAAGVSDFLPKPFNRRNLVERIKALVSSSEIKPATVIRTGSIKVNITTRSVEVNDQQITLSPNEYRILELLSLRKGKIIPTANFIIHLFDADDVPESPAVIDEFVNTLRQKLLQATDGEYYIDSIPDRGYVLCEPLPSAMVSRGIRYAS